MHKIQPLKGHRKVGKIPMRKKQTNTGGDQHLERGVEKVADVRVLFNASCNVN